MTIITTVTGGNAGTVNEQATWANTAANEQVTSQTLSSGANTVNVPTLPVQAIGVEIIPPSSNTQTIILKGVTGDTGVPISPSSVTVIPFAASPPASFCLTAGGTITGCQFRWI